MHAMLTAPQTAEDLALLLSEQQAQRVLAQSPSRLYHFRPAAEALVVIFREGESLERQPQEVGRS